MKEKVTLKIFFSFNTFCFPHNIEVKLDWPLQSGKLIFGGGGGGGGPGGSEKIRQIKKAPPPPCIKHPRVLRKRAIANETVE